MTGSRIWAANPTADATGSLNFPRYGAYLERALSIPMLETPPEWGSQTESPRPSKEPVRRSGGNPGTDRGPEFEKSDRS